MIAILAMMWYKLEEVYTELGEDNELFFEELAKVMTEVKYWR